MVNLTLTEKGGSTNELSFDKGEVTVGRVRGNDIVLPKGNVSKHHCRFVTRNGEIVVEDLHSTNGTYVNGRKIGEPTSLAPGDKIFVGDFIMRIAVYEAMRAPAPLAHPEAGSLSSAIPRRPPPPPPPHRGGASDEGMGSGPKVPPPLSGRQPLPPPPPPPVPPKRDSRGIPAVSDVLSSSPSSSPSDINLDDDEDGTPLPHFTVPPLKPAVQPAERLSDMETPDGLSSGTTPPPARERKATDISLDEDRPDDEPAASSEVPPPPAAASSDEDDIFTSPPPSRSGAKPHAAAHAPEAAKGHEPAKPKHPLPAAKAAAQKAERDMPDWLTHLLDADGVTAAYFVGGNQAEVQRYGHRESVSVPASDLAGLGAAVRKLVVRGSPKPAPDAAAINTTLPDGLHVSAIFPPVADRLCVAVRRPVALGKTIEDLVEEKVISAEMRQVLDACVASRQNMLVSGDRAACDSLLRAVLWSVDRQARVALVSGAITPPASASSWLKLQPEGQAGDLVAALVAMQPEYLVVDASHAAVSGEVLGECNLGLGGAILSVMARSTDEALHRLQGLACARGTPQAVGADLVASSIDVIVQASLLNDGSLKVVEIAEPKASLDGQLSAHALLTFIPGEDGQGSFTVTGAHSTLASKLAQAGNEVPPTILSRQ
jgi:pilus assembly protein CpaF